MRARGLRERTQALGPALDWGSPGHHGGGRDPSGRSGTGPSPALEGASPGWGGQRTCPGRSVVWPGRWWRWGAGGSPRGLVDCHTHLVFAGDRSGEFEARLQGATYEEIAREGGGIRTTMRATREASEDELVRGGRPDASGTSSRGRGHHRGGEVRIRDGDGDRAADAPGGDGGSGDPLRSRSRPAFLGAHVLPPGVRRSPGWPTSTWSARR